MTANTVKTQKNAQSGKSVEPIAIQSDKDELEEALAQISDEKVGKSVILKGNKSTTFFDMLLDRKSEKVKTENLPSESILKIKDILKWQGMIQNQPKSAIYLRATMHYLGPNNEQIIKEILWFPPTGVITRMKHLHVVSGNILYCKNNGLVPESDKFPKHYNIYVEKLEQ